MTTPNEGKRMTATEVLRKLIESQARDEGLWFKAETAPEGYLQVALRRLHGAVESFFSQPEPQAMSAEGCCCAIHHPNYGRCLQCPIHGSPPPDLSRKEKA